MAINWITPEGILVSDFEETTLNNIIIEVETSVDSFYMESGTLPEGLILEKIDDKRYELKGILPIVTKDTTYAFTMRTELGEEISDRYFLITIKTKVVEWNLPTNDYEVYEMNYFSLQLQLLNANGDETFIKESGELPPNLQINEKGLIYGVIEELPSFEDVKIEKKYTFDIAVKRKDTTIITEQMNILVKTLTSLDTPVWITDGGNLGSLNYQEGSTMFVKAYDPVEESTHGGILYELTNEGNLPTGLTLNANTGYIEGKLQTEFIQEWTFNIKATNNIGNSSVQEFTIQTNIIADKDKVSWKTDPILGDFSIGENVYFKLDVESIHPCSFNLIAGSLPLGCSFNTDGEIIGTIEYQDLKPYEFLIEVSNGFSTINRMFNMNVVKGLGKNACECILYINNEYLTDYGNMKGAFDRRFTYNTSNIKYNIPAKPAIDICTLNCIDKTLLSHLLTYDTSIDVTWGKTQKKDYFNTDGTHIYSAFYKEVDENVSNGGIKEFSGNKIYIYEKEGQWIDEKTNKPIIPNSEVHTEEFGGKEYITIEGIKVYVKVLDENIFYESESKAVITFGTPVYIEWSEVGETYYITRDNIDIAVNRASSNMLATTTTNVVLDVTIDSLNNGISVEPPQIRHYFIDIDSNYKLDFSSISEIRNKLSSKIYVEKLNQETVYYDTGTQEIITTPLKKETFDLNYDEERDQYYVEYNGELTYYQIYALTEDGTTVPVQASMDGKMFETIQIYDEIEKTDVNYKLRIVSTLDGEVQENIIFTATWDNISFVIIQGEVIFISKTSNPWIYRPENNLEIGYDKTIVLPFISDEDIRDESSTPYIMMFDKENETVIEWKEEYFPSLNIFYGTPNTNVILLNTLNNKEEYGEYWTGREFQFYEIHCQPKYNNLDNFAIPFYNISIK